MIFCERSSVRPITFALISAVALIPVASFRAGATDLIAVRLSASPTNPDVLAKPPDTTIVHPRLDGGLNALLAESAGAQATADPRIHVLGPRILAGRALVEVNLTPPSTDSFTTVQQDAVLGEFALAGAAERAEALDITASNVRGAIGANGGSVTWQSRDFSTLHAWIPVDQLHAIAGSLGVVSVRIPAEATALSVSSEALPVMNAPAWHGGGVDGLALKVGIVDRGFQGYTAKLGTELPAAANVTVKNFVDSETDSQVDGAAIHGTACAEIVHDVAPQAPLYLAKVTTVADVDEAVTWLIAQGVQVVSSSIGFFVDGPGDGTGQLGDSVRRATDAGIVWVNSAGNSQKAHWGGAFADTNANSVLDFTGTDYMNLGPSPGLVWSVPPGFTVTVSLRWADWSSVSQDLALDIYTVDAQGLHYQYTANTPQTGQPGQKPIETTAFLHSNPTPLSFAVVVRKVAGSAPVNLDLFTSLDIQQPVNARSISNLADIKEAITVAALDYSTLALQPYSSFGPTNGPGGVLAGGSNKPDIAGYDHVSTATYSPLPFDGTSAAAPHVAGAIALYRRFYLSSNRQDVTRALERRAQDLGAPGLDTQYGFGALTLDVWPSDFDGDGRGDDGNASGVAGDVTCSGGNASNCDDNCPFFANAIQGDGGGVGSGSASDGIGNDCQCGDVTADTRVTIADATMIRRATQTPPTATMTRPDLCDVGGSAGCTQADEVILRRALLTPPTP